MRLKKQKKLKGQALVEYGAIAFVVVVALVASTKGISVGMKNQVEFTKKGLSSGSHLKK